MAVLFEALLLLFVILHDNNLYWSLSLCSHYHLNYNLHVVVIITAVGTTTIRARLPNLKVVPRKNIYIVGETIKAESTSRPRPVFTWTDIGRNKSVLSRSDTLFIDERMLNLTYRVRVTAVNANGNISLVIRFEVTLISHPPVIPDEPGSIS